MAKDLGDIMKDVQAARDLISFDVIGELRDKEAAPIPAALLSLTKGMDGSYAQVGSSPRHSVVVASTDPNKTADATIAEKKGKVDVIALGIGVNAVRKLRDQKVLLSCDTGEGREVFKRELSGAGGLFTVTEPADKRPLIRLVGVARDVPDEQVVAAIESQNRDLMASVALTRDDARVLRRTNGRNGAHCNVILEVNPEIWRRMEGARVRLGYQVVLAVDQSPLVQCYRCMGYGHTARICRAEARCGRCSGEHQTRDCPPSARAGDPRCCHCAKVTGAESSHPAYAADWPERIRWDSIARQAIKYY